MRLKRSRKQIVWQVSKRRQLPLRALNLSLNRHPKIIHPPILPPPNPRRQSPNPTPPPMAADIITTILTWSSPDFTAKELAEIIGVSTSSVTEAIRLKRIEALSLDMRGSGKRQRLRITRISKLAAIRWIWRNTTGDRATLRATLADHAPSLLKRLEKEPDPEQPTLPKPQPRKLLNRPETWHPNQLALFPETCTPTSSGS